MQIAVIDALTTLSHLQDLHLTFYDGPPQPLLPLARLSGLKTISLTGSWTSYCTDLIGELAETIAQSPGLVHLEVRTSTNTSEEPPTLHDLLSKVPQGRPLRLTHLVLSGVFVRMDSRTLPHLRSLAYLDLHRLPGSPFPDWGRTRGCKCTITEIYAALNREKVHLKQVVLHGLVDDAVLDYLDSYSGLEVLELRTMYSKDDALGHRFYTSVLPKHVDSIQVLKIRPCYEGRWCCNVDDVSVLSQCNKLRSLTVALDSTPDVVRNQLSILDSSDSPREYQPHYYRDNFDDTVCVNDHLTRVFFAHLIEPL
jgi:hypothetical protein